MIEPTSSPIPSPITDLSFPHLWQAEILSRRPLILPNRHFVYPRDVEEVERGALEVFVHPGEKPGAASRFLATCALGFRDPSVPTGIWSCPSPNELCAVAGGYAYIIDTATPERFTMVPYRPVFAVYPAHAQGLLLFVGSRTIFAWGVGGQEWESAKLSDEGLTILAIEDGILRGMGWNMMTDKEAPFLLDLATGQKPSEGINC
jgi:hypothetical protein